MILQFTTGKLPPNFFILGILLVLIGILAVIMSEFEGLIAILLSVPLLFIRTGILVDTEKKRIKKYIGLFSFKNGKWESISQIQHLRIIRVQQSASMAVLSISRIDTSIVYKLILVMPTENMEILSGDGRFISEVADEISTEMNLEVKDVTPKNKS